MTRDRNEGGEPARVTTGPLSPGRIERHCAEAAMRGAQCLRVDLEGCADKQELLARISDALAFPDWFGGNWDALFDCLNDMSWMPAEGYLLVLENADEFLRDSPDAFAVARSIFEDAAAAWHARGVEMSVLVDATPPTHQGA